MQYIKGLDAFDGRNHTAVTLGKFDGLHRGHQKLIKKVCQLKAKKGVRSVVFAFDMNPLYEKLGKSREGIMSNEERRCLLDKKVDVLLECPFSEDVTSMSAEDFIRKILIEKIHARYIVIGTDFHFGHDKRGDAKMLAEYADVYGYELFVIEKEMYGKREISSSYVREELRKGNMEAVNDMLGYAYTVRGKVEHGRQLGRKLGFPTLNVHPSRDKLLPPNGVYLDSVRIDGIWYNGIGNVGFKPTVSDENRMLIESNLLDYSGDAYGKEVEIQLYHFKRPEQKFESIEMMKAQIDQDIAYAKEFFRYHHKK